MPVLDFTDQASAEPLDFSAQAKEAPDFSSQAKSQPPEALDFSSQALAEPPKTTSADFSPESEYTPPNFQSLKEFFMAHPNIPKPDTAGAKPGTFNPVEKAAVGLARSAIGAVESLATPLTAGLAAVSAIPVVGKPAAIAAGAGFGVHTAITSSMEFLDAVKRGDVQGAAEAAGNVVLGGGLAVFGGKEAIKATKEAVATKLAPATTSEAAKITGSTEVPKAPETAPIAPITTAVANEITKGNEPNAIQVNQSGQEVLRQQTPPPGEQLGLQGLDQGNTQPQELAKSRPEATPVSGAQGEIIPPEGPGAAGVGTPGTTKTQLEQLTDVVRGMDKSNIPWQEQFKASIDNSVAQAQELGGKALATAKGTYAYLKNKILGPPGFTEWKRGVNQWNAEDQISARNAYFFSKETAKTIPQPARQAAISKWVDSGGDLAILQAGEAATRPEFKQAYRDAQNLSPEELNLARNIQNYFDAKLQDAIDNGLIEAGLDNYIHRIYPKESKTGQGAAATINAGTLQPNPSLIRQRLFQFDYEAEAAGKSPVQGFADRILAYDQSFNRALSARSFIKWLQTNHKESDGRPSVDVAGMGKVLEDPVTGAREGVLINPHYKTKGLAPGATPAEIALNNRADYLAYDHPALRKWKWVAEDADGNPIMVQGDLLVHKDRIKKLDALLGKSWFQKSEIPKAILGVSSTIKQTMLDLTLFHPVQEKFHSLEHKVVRLREIDLNDADQKALVEHALVIFDHRAQQMFSEGLAGGSLSRQIPWIGPKLAQAHDYQFKEWIPKIKMTMAVDALARNRKRYTGKLSEDDILYLTAKQANAAFGFQNYRDMGMHSSYQDALRAFALAPDFLMSRAQFVGQGIATRYGREQLEALALGALGLYTLARIGNKIAGDEWRWDKPFEVVYHGRAYGIRSVQEDLFNAIKDTRKFIYGRVNPLTTRTMIEALTGRDYRGVKRTALEQAKDLAKTPIPIPFKTEDDKKFTEAFIAALGFNNKRASAVQDILKKATEWQKTQGVEEPGEFIYNPEKDPYRRLKIALSIGDEFDAKSALAELKADPTIGPKVARHMTMFYNRPFSGARSRETKFRESLSTGDKQLYEDALKEKAASLALFRKIN